MARKGGARGGLGGLQPLRQRHLAPRRRKFSVLVGGNLAKLRTKTPFFSHCRPPVGSSSPSVGKFLAPPLMAREKETSAGDITPQQTDTSPSLVEITRSPYIYIYIYIYIFIYINTRLITRPVSQWKFPSGPTLHSL